MEQPFSTSKVTVEYFDPHGVYKLLEPGLVLRLPLHDLHWQSHAGPARSISTLHIELLPAGSDPFSVASPLPPVSPQPPRSSDRDDGFTTQAVAGGVGRTSTPTDHADHHPPASTLSTLRPGGGANPGPGPRERRHQIPGLRRTPYLKILLVRCDDADTYKSHTRGEIRDWIKEHTPPAQSTRRPASASSQENHDAFEWLIVHVVIPNTAAATQARTTTTAAAAAARGSESSGAGEGASGGGGSGSGAGGSTGSINLKGSGASRWRGGSSTLLEKLRSDFNGTSKHGVDRVAQIRIGINDVPYDLLPRVVPAVPSGYAETAQEARAAWLDLVDKLKRLILSSFDLRVGQYEEDIKEKDAQRTMPGWNFCTFFILKEGLARGFESVGLVEDALVGYDELAVGLDAVVQEQAGDPKAAAKAGALLDHTSELAELADRAVAAIHAGTGTGGGSMNSNHSEDGGGAGVVVDLQQQQSQRRPAPSDYDDIAISAAKKPYRDMILANNVSLFDFRCYLFARQTALLLRLGNAWSTREELLAKLKEQQESVLHGVASRAPAPKATDEAENLAMLAEICRRTLEFIPAVSQVMRRDIFTALATKKKEEKRMANVPAGDVDDPDVLSAEAVDNLVASFAFSVAQQILAQTSSKALPVPPPSTLGTSDRHEQKASIPEPKTMMHPARSTSLHVLRSSQPPPPPPLSPGVFPGPGAAGRASSSSGQPPDGAHSQLLKVGLEELAARRAELYALSRNILGESGKKRGWGDGWDEAPMLGGRDGVGTDLVEVSLRDDEDDDDEGKEEEEEGKHSDSSVVVASTGGIGNGILRTALENKDDFYRLYETLTDKALRHYSIADHTHSMEAMLADLAVLHYHLGEYGEAAFYFDKATPFFGASGWTLLELSMLVMYARCLRELQRPDKYVQVLIKLLSKAAAAERDRRDQRAVLPDRSALAGFFDDLLAATEGLPNEVRLPASHFLSELEMDGPPVYDEGQDSFSLQCRIYSLLADTVEISSAKARLAPAAGGTSPLSSSLTSASTTKEIWVVSRGPIQLKPGRNKITLRSNQVLPGDYEMDLVKLTSGNISLYHERDRERDHTTQPVHQQAQGSLLRHPRVYLLHRAGSLDVRLTTGKHIQLDKNNTLDLELLTGWNDIKTCELRIRSATGGLRLLMAEAEVVDPPFEVRHPEGGLFTFGPAPAHSSIRIRFPLSTEQEVGTIAVRAEVAYTTPHGSFAFAKTPAVPVGLALAVNVQDVFKHAALFSRFTVSAATPSPLRLYSSELLGSDLFRARFGCPPADPVVVFPRQPASLLYKITRRRKKTRGAVEGARTGKGGKEEVMGRKTMYLRLFYSVVQEEMEALLERAMGEALRGTGLADFASVIVGQARDALHARGLTPQDLERAALLGELSTSFLAGDKQWEWERRFTALGKTAALDIAAFIHTWQRQNPCLGLPEHPDPSPAAEVRSILIPVAIPSIPVVHTADIRIPDPRSLATAPNGGHGKSGHSDALPLLFVNELLPATLHLKWTRIWDTADPVEPGQATTRDEDLEFSYEVAAPTDTWLLGGRRKGHFVIPAAVAEDANADADADPPGPDSDSDSDSDAALAGLSSGPDTEADIPLLLVPLREGWLPFPSVEIRAVRNGGSPDGSGGSADGSGAVGQGPAHCETDCRNIGETLRVVADRERVTISLDASGPGGGPLVLGSEGCGRGRGMGKGGGERVVI